MYLNDADGMENSADTYQTAPLSQTLVCKLCRPWSGSALFAQPFLSSIGAPVTQWVKRWPTYLGVLSLSPSGGELSQS